MFSMGPERIAAIRHSYGLSQRYFALLLGISVRTLQNWEIGHRIPCGPAFALLDIAARDSEAFLNKQRRRSDDAKEIAQSFLKNSNHSKPAQGNLFDDIY